MSAPRVGADLRAARERNGWQLAEVADSLRIRRSYLEAIEAGRTNDLPGKAYALGFLRNYASALGLDAEEMARRFKAEVAELNTDTELTFPAPIPDHGVPPAVVIVFGLIIAVGAYAGWYHFAERAPNASDTAEVPAKLARLADPTALLPAPEVPHSPKQGNGAPATSGPSGAQTPLTAQASGASGAGVPVAPNANAAVRPSAPSLGAQNGAEATLPTDSQSTPVTTPATPAATSATAAPSASPGTTSTDTTAPAVPSTPSTPVVVIKASAEAWIEVRDSSGAVIFTKLMRPGESWTVPDRPGLVLTTGNAGGTELLVNGKPAPSLGGLGKVERDQPLDPALIKSGALPAQIAAAAGQPSGAASAAVSRSTSESP